MFIGCNITSNINIILFRQKDIESDMDRLKVLEGESEAFSFFKTQEDEEEKAKKKKDRFFSKMTVFVQANAVCSDGSCIDDVLK